MEKDEKLIPSPEEEGCEAAPEENAVCDIDTESTEAFEEEELTEEAEEVFEEAEVTENDVLGENASIFAEVTPDLSDFDESKIIRADGNFDGDEWINGEDVPQKNDHKIAKSVFEFLEMLALVTVCIVLCFAFVFRLNIVDGPSMENTLHTGEYLIVSDLCYTPAPGDIVVVHDLTMGHYTDPIVKRVIATEGQVVDIDFTTWTLTVDGKVVDESSYRKLDGYLVTSNLQFPLTVEENTVFVLGDNRNHSADSRLAEIGCIDERSIVGKVYARVFPFDKFTIFKNPYTQSESK